MLLEPHLIMFLCEAVATIEPEKATGRFCTDGKWFWILRFGIRCATCITDFRRGHCSGIILPCHGITVSTNWVEWILLESESVCPKDLQLCAPRVGGLCEVLRGVSGPL